MKKTFFLLITAITIVSACSSPKPNSKSDLSLADQTLDQQLYSEAVGSGNVEKCAKIMAKDLKQECADIVNAITITNKAIIDGDKKACANIELERYRENCEDSVSSDIEAKDADRKVEENIQATEAKAIASADPNVCNSIDDENQKYSCRYNVVVNQAIAAKNPKLCQAIGRESVVLECENAVGNN